MILYLDVQIICGQLAVDLSRFGVRLAGWLLR